MSTIEAAPRVRTTAEPAKADPGQRLKSYDGILEAYRKPEWKRGIWQLVTTLTAYAVAWTLTYLSLQVSYWLTLAISIPTALLLVRVFILQHDCGHYSLLPSKKVCDTIGAMLGVFTFTPYYSWRREHAVHHACSGHLDRRGRHGEIFTLTIDEYRELGPVKKLGYRIFRNPLFLFGAAPFFQFVIYHRFPSRLAKTWKKERRSVMGTNLGMLAVYGTLCWLLGPLEVLLVQLPIIFIGAGAGVWLFYVQHQYEEAFWEREENWNYVDAAMAGSSYYRLPRVLQWFTGNIGFHHIHHLDSRIPNYHLPRCHHENTRLQSAPTLTLADTISCMNVALWDEQNRRMVSFAEARRMKQADG